ncbi:MAG: FeoA family protein [Halobacteriota archaeon]|nr:FeoA family protein [Halobacteriota archaeon]
METSLVDLENGDSGKITRITGGHGQQRHMRSLGVREGKEINIIAKQPIGGPIIVDIDGNRIAIGRGMANRVMVET